MPVVLSGEDEWNIWLSGPEQEALALQKPLSADSLRLVAAGEKSDQLLAAD
jgi:putative SOS response-associated peptidase YedK